MADRQQEIQSTWDRYVGSAALDELVAQLTEAEIVTVIGEKLAMDLRVYTRKRMDTLQNTITIEGREHVLQAWKPAHRYDPGKKNPIDHHLAPREEFAVDMAAEKLRNAMQAPPTLQPLSNSSKMACPSARPQQVPGAFSSERTPTPQPDSTGHWADWVALQRLEVDFKSAASTCERFFQNYKIGSPEDQQTAAKYAFGLQKSFVYKADGLNSGGDTDFRLARGNFIRDVVKLIERLEARVGADKINWDM